jgi:hypothetical protein
MNLSTTMLSHYAECCILIIVMLNVIIPSVMAPYMTNECVCYDNPQTAIFQVTFNSITS